MFVVKHADKELYLLSDEWFYDFGVISLTNRIEDAKLFSCDDRACMVAMLIDGTCNQHFVVEKVEVKL